MADELAREIQELISDIEGTSRPPRQYGSWSAFARIYDVKGTSCWCQLYDNHLLPCERTLDFMMDFSRVDPSFHASCVKEPGLLIGALELNVVDLNPIKVLVMEDTIMRNIPVLKPEQPWASRICLLEPFLGGRKQPISSTTTMNSAPLTHRLLWS